jgi:hypothetical protein
MEETPVAQTLAIVSGRITRSMAKAHNVVQHTLVQN